jgi:hypothetical protein
MVALELFTLSGLYTAGNAAKYFIECYLLNKGDKLYDGTQLQTSEQPVQKFVELSVEKSNYHPPFYVNPGGNHGSIGIPVGGGTTTEFEELLSAVVSEKKENHYNWRITDLDTRNRCAAPQKFWLNTPDDLKGFFEQHKIPMNLIPLSLPIQVREVKVPANTPVYSVRSAVTIGSHKASVVKTAAWVRSFGRYPATSAVATCLTLVLGVYHYLNWDDYYEREKRARYMSKFTFS